MREILYSHNVLITTSLIRIVFLYRFLFDWQNVDECNDIILSPLYIHTCTILSQLSIFGFHFYSIRFAFFGNLLWKVECFIFGRTDDSYNWLVVQTIRRTLHSSSDSKGSLALVSSKIIYSWDKSILILCFQGEEIHIN